MNKNQVNYRYILFYKPYGVLCQFTDNTPGETPRKLLKDYLKIPDIYSVGRLDQDSEGLLLLTNNPKLNKRLLDPQFAHPRTYLVQVENIPDHQALNQLRKGVKIQNYLTRPAKVKILPNEPNLPPRDPPIRYRKTIPTCWLEMTLTEGKNRQVRRMTAAVGCPTLRLVRMAIGIHSKIQLNLTGLQPGEWRDCTTEEVKYLEKI